MSSAWERYFRQQKDFERILRHIGPSIDAFRAVSGPLREHLHSLEHFRQSFGLSTAQLDALKAVESSMRGNPAIGSLRRLVGLELPIVRAMQEQQVAIDNISAQLSSNADLRLAQRLAESLAPTEALLSIDKIPRPLLEASLQPRRAFQEFAKAQLEKAASLEGTLRTKRILALDATADLLGSFNPSVHLAADWWSKIATPSLEKLPPVNVFEAVAEGLDEVGLEGEELDADAFVEECAPGRILEVGGQICSLVFNINTEAERNGDAAVFKPTNKGMRAAAILSSHVASDEQSFAVIIDHLFFLLYEASGDAKRLLARVGDSVLAPLWVVKHLRLSDRHDLEHGKEGDIRRKNQRVGGAFQGLIGASMPRDPADWALAQAALYQQLREMLECIWRGEET